MQIYERLKKVLEELEDLNSTLKSKAIEKAIENVKIALYSEKVGSEGFKHSYMRRRIVEILGGNVYVESELTGISKIGYRPDLVIIRGNEVRIVEIETDRRGALRKMRKVSNLLKDLKTFARGRTLKVTFVISDWDENVLKFAKDKGFEIYLLEGEELRLSQ